jgi:hypothetical protein
MGSEHALGDEARVRNWLVSELAELSPGPGEPLLDPISPDEQVLRIHLRPFVRLNLDEETLLRSFMLTAEKVTPSAELLLEYAKVAKELAEDGALQFGADEISVYIEDLASSGFPAVHHSRRYELEYLPAYRVVARDALPEEILASA